MRIAQIAPLYESVPPTLYGGTERIVSYLTEELVALGHDVTLFASGDSTTSARLVPITQRALRLDEGCIDQLAHHVVMLEQIARRSSDFDILHFHIDYLHFPLSRLLDVPRVTTLHGRLDIPDLVPLYELFSDEPVVSISDSQRVPLPIANWVGTVYHGLPASTCAQTTGKRDYLAFLGRISPEKGVERAVEIARGAGLLLKVAAKVDRADQQYYERDVAPLFDDPLVEYCGEIGEQDKPGFLAGARALLFPIDWEEPFGLVMIEAMSCGTPVIAHPRGSVPEVLEDGVTGIFVDSVDEAIAAVRRVESLSRPRIRAEFERRFTASHMARNYLDVYRSVIAGRASLRRSDVSMT